MVIEVRKQKLKKGEIILLAFDYVFTAIFNNENNISIIKRNKRQIKNII